MLYVLRRVAPVDCGPILITSDRTLLVGALKALARGRLSPDQTFLLEEYLPKEAADAGTAMREAGTVVRAAGDLADLSPFPPFPEQGPGWRMLRRSLVQ
jgi:hypothetical protein